MQNYYELLKVKSDASSGEIKKSYHILASKYHPDKHPDNKKYAEEMMKEINVAHGILLDPESRRKYDESLQPNLTNQNAYESQTYYSNEESNGEPPPLFESLKEHKILILAAIVIIGIIIFGEKRHQVGTSPKLDMQIQNIPREKLI